MDTNPGSPTEMTSRQRLLMALNHQEPDCIPYDLGGTLATGMHLGVYPKLRRCFGLPEVQPHPRHLFTQEASLDEDFLDAAQVDTRLIIRRSTLGERYTIRKEGDYHVVTDQWGITWRMPVEKGLYFDVWLSPFDRDDIEAQLQQQAWPDPTDPWHVEGLREQAKAMREKGKAVGLMGFAAGIGETYAWLRGYNRYFTDLGMDHEKAEYFFDKLADLKASFWEVALGRLGDVVDYVNETDDLASQNSLLMSPRTYRKLVKPRHRRIFEAIKQAAPHVKIFYHTCGAVRPLIPDLIEIGVDLLNPIQLSARDMHPSELKREFGKDICFWGGGVNAQGVLGPGTPEQVRENVLRNVDALAPGGGFVFAADHIIQANVPPENFMAMWETFQEIKRYS